MMNRNEKLRNTKWVLVMAVAAIGGAPLFGAGPAPAPGTPAGAQPMAAAGDNNMNAKDTNAKPIDAAHMVFRTWSKLKGDNIYSVTDDKKLGDIADVLISRGSGRIDYLVVKTDTTLGLGGKLVLVPYNELTLKDGDRHEYRYDATQDHFKNMPEFTAQGWQDIGKPNAGAGSKTLAEALARQGARERHDRFANRVDTGQKATTIEGKITEINHSWNGNTDEVVVTIQDDAGKKQEVNLGPAWFALGGEFPPQRGERVKVTTLKTTGGDATMVASTFSIGGHDVRYREDTGKAAWANADEAAISPARHVLATEIAGKEVDTKGSRCGKVDDLIIERSSGYVAFLSIDPDQNFMGIGDTKRLVPFGVVNARHDGKVSLDATKEMVLASSPYPKTLDDLRTEDFRTKAYSGFQVRPQSFMAREHMNPGQNK